MFNVVKHTVKSSNTDKQLLSKPTFQWIPFLDFQLSHRQMHKQTSVTFTKGCMVIILLQRENAA